MKKFVTLVSATILAALILLGFSLNVNSSLSQGIVRLHVIANSDSDGDQILKLYVRDEILKRTNADFTKKDEVIKNLSLYKTIAEDTLRRYGCEDTVRAEYGNFAFPTKHYKNLSLPAGNYDAVRITIGEGKGKNWWCVLFPPLCFVDGTTDSSGAAEKMKKMLKKSDYDLITAQSADGGVPVNIKFKVVEFYGKLCGRDKVYAAKGKDKF